MELSRYQEKILKYFNDNPRSNMMISALAGSGKSTMACLLSEHTTTSDIYVAFNNSIAEEFRTKIKNPKTKVMTLHSLGLSIMNSNIRTAKEEKKITYANATLDNLKIYKIIDNELTILDRRMDFMKKMFYKDQYFTLYNLCRLTMTNLADSTALRQIIQDYRLFENDEGYQFPVITDCISMLKNVDGESWNIFNQTGVIDFTDMLYITYWKLEKKEWEVPYYNLYTNIYIDEFQDTNKIQQHLLKFIKRKNGRYVFIGDYHQCQPEGTKVLLIDGEVKNIEDLVYGDRVVEYSTSRGNFMSMERKSTSGDGSFYGVHSRGANNIYYEVVDKQKFYSDHLITITTQDGKKSSYTSNHNCLVKFNREKTEEAVSLYLMERRDGLFRIGIVKLYGSQNSLGLKARAKSEGFDRCWLLNIYETHKDAWVAEQTYSLKYQIPQVIFQQEKVLYTEDDIKMIYSGVPNMRARAIALLEEFGRDINYPIWVRNDVFSHAARDHCFITQSCNIIPVYMDALVFNGEENFVQKKNQTIHSGHYVSKYSQITKVEHQFGLFPVYGITTSKYHTYIADGIATHNSIYNFSGADSNSFNNVRNLFAPIKEFDLPICYRCPSSHLKEVNRLFNIPILPRDDAPKGKIYHIEKEDISYKIYEGDMIISRKNKWLGSVIVDLAKAGKPIQIEDKEMVASIKKIVEKNKNATAKGLRKDLKEEVTKYNQEKAKKSSQLLEAVQENNIEEVATAIDDNKKIDNYNFILGILKEYLKKNPNATKDNFAVYISNLLNTGDSKTSKSNVFAPKVKPIRICSVHKAKGLEAENVFVLNEGRICFDFRNSKEQNQQEKNLSYISYTRAKNNLYLVSEKNTNSEEE